MLWLCPLTPFSPSEKMRWLDGITDTMDMNLNKIREMGRDREPWHAAVYGVTKSWTLLGN